MPRGQYDHTQVKPRVKRSLHLNPFQRDVLLGTVSTELNRIKTDNSVPKSLKLLAIRELSSLKSAIEELPGMDGEENGNV